MFPKSKLASFIMRTAVAVLIILTVISPAVVARPVADSKGSPPICLAICYFEKPDCGESGVSDS